jgi:predicted nuclease of predicted toxin-antitoxin system
LKLARFYTDENFPFPIVEFLRNFGHDVLTALDAGNANLKIPDESVLAFAKASGRAVLTRNRRDFIRLHNLEPEHTGILVCRSGSDFESQARLIHQAVSAEEDLKGKLIRINTRE